MSIQLGITKMHLMHSLRTSYQSQWGLAPKSPTVDNKESSFVLSYDKLKNNSFQGAISFITCLNLVAVSDKKAHIFDLVFWKI